MQKEHIEALERERNEARLKAQAAKPLKVGGKAFFKSSASGKAVARGDSAGSR